MHSKTEEKPCVQLHELYAIVTQNNNNLAKVLIKKKVKERG